MTNRAVLAASQTRSLSLGQECDNLTIKLQETVAQVTAITAEKDSLGAHLEAAKLELQALAAQKGELSAELTTAAEKIANLEGQLEELTQLPQQLADSQAKIADLEGQLQGLNQLPQQLADSQAKIADLEGQLQELTQLPQQLETYRENISNLEIQLHQLSAEKDQLETTTSRHIEELSQQNRQLTQDLEVKKTADKALEKEKIKFEGELATKQKEIAALEVQIQNLKQERDDFSPQTAPITTNGRVDCSAGAKNWVKVETRKVMTNNRKKPKGKLNSPCSR